MVVHTVVNSATFFRQLNAINGRSLKKKQKRAMEFLTLVSP
jgi:flagellar biosynthesis/type III secretory pathway chaperone